MNLEERAERVAREVLDINNYELNNPNKLDELMMKYERGPIDIFLLRDSEEVLLNVLKEKQISDESLLTKISEIYGTANLPSCDEFKSEKSFFTELSDTSQREFTKLCEQVKHNLKNQIVAHYSSLQSFYELPKDEPIEAFLDILPIELDKYLINMQSELLILLHQYIDLLPKEKSKPPEQDIMYS